MEGCLKLDPVYVRIEVLPPTQTLVKQLYEAISLLRRDVTPEDIEPQRVSQLHLLQTPNRQWIVLALDSFLYSFRVGFMDVEFQ